MNTASFVASAESFASCVSERLSSEESMNLDGLLLAFVEADHPASALPEFLEAGLLATIRIVDPSSSCTSVKEYLELIHMEKTSSTPRGVCGYMFKLNDIAWNCRDCQMDDTCVLCQSCFQNSNHEGHQVFFHRTNPGGMCDCGDNEAWKPEGFCCFHKGNDAVPAVQVSVPEPLERVLLGVLKEFVCFLTYVAHRSMASFDDEHAAELAEETRLAHLAKFPHDPKPKIFHVRISNDDVHTDEDLIISLQKKGFGAVFAQSFTRDVDRQGCGLLRKNQTFVEALDLMRMMQAENWFVSIVDDRHVAMENVCKYALEYLLSLASPVIQLMLVNLLFTKPQAELPMYKHDPSDIREPLRVLLQATPFMNKTIFQLLAQVYLKIMGEKDQKLQFAKMYAKVYSRLALQYFCGKGTNKESLFNLGVQIFTTPSIVSTLIDHGFLDELLSALQSGFELAESDDHTLSMAHMVVRYRRYQPLVMDLNHILVNPNISIRFCTDDAVEMYCYLLQSLAGINLQRRVPENQHHIESEDDQAWIGAFNLHLTTSAIAPALFKGLRLCEPAEFGRHITKLSDTVWPLLHPRTPFDYHVVTIFGESYRLVNYSVESDFVSMHYPLHHLFSRIVLEWLAASLEPSLPLVDRDVVDAMLEFPLRTFVLASQVVSNLWVRNGNDLMLRQLTSYYNIGYNLSFRDLDLHLIQSCIVYSGPNHFFASFLDRYGVYPWLTQAEDAWLERIPSNKQLMYLADCLLKFLWIVTELPPPPEQSIDVLLRREVIHFLSYQPFLYSALREQTEPLYAHPRLESVSDDTKNKQLIAILKEVADCQSVSAHDMTPTKFSLKPAFFQEYDPAFVHLSPTNHVKAQVARQETVFKQWQPTSELIPMVMALPAYHPAFHECRAMVVMPHTFEFIHLCLKSPNIRKDETVLTRLVHILTIQLLVMNDPLITITKDQFIRELCISMDFSYEPLAAKRLKTETIGGVANESIISVLAEAALGYKNNLEASTKPLLSAILYLLKEYSKMDERIATFLEKEVFPKQSEHDANEPMDHKARLALQKKKQQQAMAAIMQRQSQFAQSMLNDGNFDDSMDEVEEESGDNAQPSPECIICTQTKKDEPVMFIALSQVTTPLRKYMYDSVSPRIHVQLCGHAVHLPCVVKYQSTVVREAGNIINQRGSIAFDAMVGEFLCPLCKSLSNTIIPFVPRSVPLNPLPRETMLESFFQGSGQSDKITEYLLSTLPSALSSAPPTETVAHAFDGMCAFLFTLRNYRPINLANPMSIVQLVLDIVNQGFDAAELQGLSSALFNLEYSEEPVDLKQRMGIDLPSEMEAFLNPFTTRDDAKFHALLLLLNRLSVMMPSVTYKNVVPIAISRALDPYKHKEFYGTLSLSDYAATIASGMPPMFGLPLLGQDLFSTLLLVCSILREKAEMLWAIRCFCALNMVQVMLTCMQSCEDVVDAPETLPNLESAKILMDWRTKLADTLKVSVDPAAPQGALLKYLFESTSMTFLRKAALLARAIFHGPNDSDAALYVNFINHLQLSSNFEEMCLQLGVPLPADLIACASFTNYITEQLNLFKDTRAPFAWKNPTDPPVENGVNATLACLPRLALMKHNKELWINHLAMTHLSKSYTDFYALHSSHLCPTTLLPQESTAICMRCGAAVCAGTECCKRSGRGSCFQHVEHCGHGNGAFFLLKACTMLFVSCHGRSCFFPSPYVDEFGEEDIYVKRGRPLLLRPKRLLAVIQHLGGHTIALEVSKVRRTSEQYIRAYYY